MQIVTVGATHVGLVREVNEDAYLARPSISLVADGMGGHAAGDFASALTIHAFQNLASRENLEPKDVVEAVAQANQAILSEVECHPERTGMGTTLTGVAVVEQAGSPHWMVFNIGDSRVYRIEDGSALQLTVDHSEVAELVAAGVISGTEARVHPLRNVITRSLGSTDFPEVETWLFPATVGDLFLICSDGLTSELEDAQIAGLVYASSDLSSAAAALIDATLASGAHDNVTVVLVAAQGDEPSEAADTSAFSTRPRSAAGAGA
jgi:PPM family protein phosphatase